MKSSARIALLQRGDVAYTGQRKDIPIGVKQQPWKHTDWAAVAALRVDVRVSRALGGRAAQKGEKGEERERHFCSEVKSNCARHRIILKLLI